MGEPRESIFSNVKRQLAFDGPNKLGLSRHLTSMRAIVTLAEPIAFLSALRMSTLSLSDPVQQKQLFYSKVVLSLPCLLP